MVTETEVIHYPTLKTVMMVEEAIKKAEDYPSLRQLWLSLPNQVMYQTFKIIIDYLIESNKIIIDDDGSIVWVAMDSDKLRKALREGRRVA